MNSEALEFLEKRIKYYLDNFDGNCSPLTELYNIKGILTKAKPIKFEYGYGYFFRYELYEKEVPAPSERYMEIQNMQVEAVIPKSNAGIIGDFIVRPEWCVKKENLLELKADVDKAINLLNKIKERLETTE
ncbi:MAG: hypothetical protein BWY95_02361 [Bacteroidetes bacterium ADurb.BinA104]|nr:MAG: hypothetical protein BWY95_02361 [Bacteroidetes bacterium ADurb.BinA104]